MSNSRRPNHISMVEVSSEGVLMEAHEAAAPEGPKSPNAGPVFPRSEIETDKTSSMSRFGSRNEIVSIDAVTKTSHELTIPRII